MNCSACACAWPPPRRPIPTSASSPTCATPGGAELWVIRDAAGNEILFPAADALVPEIDLDAGFVVIDPPPGLLELYQGG